MDNGRVVIVIAPVVLMPESVNLDEAPIRGYY